MSGSRVPFSKPVRSWIKDQISFYNGVTDPIPKGRLLARVPEAGIETSVKANGDLKVNVRYAIDDNNNAADGRVYLNDDYVLSAKGRQVISFARSYSYNGKGKSGQWKKWLAKYSLQTKPSTVQAQEFANKVLVKNTIFQKLISLKSGGRPFFEASGNVAQQADSKLSLRFKAGESHISVVKKGNRYFVKTHYVVDEDERSDNGRVILEDTFKLDASTLKLTSHLRRWKIHPDSYGNQKALDWAKKLKLQTKPSFKEAQGFVQRVVVPVLFEKPVVAKPKVSATRTMPAKKETPVKRVKLTAPKPKTSKKNYIFTFSRPVKIDRNANKGNVSGLYKRAVKSLIERYFRRRNVTKFSVDMILRFDKKTGAISKVEFHNPQTVGGRLSDKQMHGLLKNMAERVRHAIRADKKLQKIAIKIPTRFILQ